eukprot:TRINITY_DN49_c1_g1_i14.p1 TRINITY_DN49_c1_g1~~TRINITY_DN49_c1_g1_i14.p1  ORF type:complete len:1254 (-),score=235.45 TRINITY_DN49_c1_g1_i14:262-4023(-)
MMMNCTMRFFVLEYLPYSVQMRDSSKVSTEDNVTPSMDIFSLGCVVAEVMLDGSPVFDLPALLKYSAGEFDPLAVLPKIRDPYLQEMCAHMLQRIPSSRGSASEYLHRYTGDEKPFPSYFSSLFEFMAKMIHISSADERIWKVCSNYETLVSTITGFRDDKCSDFFAKLALRNVGGDDFKSKSKKKHRCDSPESLARESKQLLKEMEDFNCIFSDDHTIESLKAKLARYRKTDDELDVNSKSNIHDCSPLQSTETNDFQNKGNGLHIIISLICSSLRNVSRPAAKIAATALLVRLSEMCDDEARLQRIVPFLVSILKDPVPAVRAFALRAISRVLECVEAPPPSEVDIVSQYVLPAMSYVPKQEEEEIVQLAFGECLPTLASCASHFLDVGQFFKQQMAMAKNGTETCSPDNEREEKLNIIQIPGSFDQELGQLRQGIVDTLQGWLALMTSPFMKRAIVHDVASLCLFFGRHLTESFLLPLLLTFLNDRDRELKMTFFDHVSAIAAFIGPSPMLAALADMIGDDTLLGQDPAVVERALACLSILCELGSLSQTTIIHLIDRVLPLLVHSSPAIHLPAKQFFCAVATHLGEVDSSVFLLPKLQPLLLEEHKLSDLVAVKINSAFLNGNLRPPCSRGFIQEMLTGMVSGSSFEECWSLYGSELDLNDDSSTLKFCVDFQSIMKKYFAHASRILMIESVSTNIESPKLSVNDGLMTGLDEANTMLVPDQRFISLYRDFIIRCKEQMLEEKKSRKKRRFVPEIQVAKSVPPVSSSIMENRMKSLNLPDLPVDTGALRSSDGSFYSAFVDCAPTVSSTIPCTSFQPMYHKPKWNEWTPKGVVHSELKEHTGSIYRVIRRDDSQAFATLSGDGSCKIWRTSDLVDSRTASRATVFGLEDGELKAGCFLTDSSSLAFGGTGGSVDIFNVGDSSCLPMVSFKTPGNGGVVSLAHGLSSLRNSLLGVTQGLDLFALDIREGKSPYWKTCLPPYFGPVTDLLMGDDGHWAVITTAWGACVLWDMRYHVPVKGWQLPNFGCISKIRCFGANSSTPRVLLAHNSNDASVFDISSGECLHRASAILNENIPDVVTAMECNLKPILPQFMIPTAHQSYDSPSPFGEITGDAVNCGTKAIIAAPVDNPHSFFTAGSDRCIRLWDLGAPSKSMMVSGGGNGRSVFESVVVQLPIESPDSSFTANMTDLPVRPRMTMTVSSEAKLRPYEKAVRKGCRTGHSDAILDLELLSSPHNMLISACRDGVARVFL